VLEEPAAEQAVPLERQGMEQEKQSAEAVRAELQARRERRLKEEVVPRMIRDLERLSGKVKLVRAEVFDNRAEVEVSWDPGIGPKRPWRLFPKYWWETDRFGMWRLQGDETEKDLFELDPDKPLYWQGLGVTIVLARDEYKDIREAF
jgi:hypothetical protein